LHIQLSRIEAFETDLIASLADRIWHAYYIDFISLEQIDYMLDKFYSKTSLDLQIQEGQEFYKVICDGKISGFVSISRKQQDEYFIHKFYLLTEIHGKNTGTAVMDLVKEMIRSRSEGRNADIRLTVNRQNYKAINFYFKNKFIIESVEDFDIGNTYFMTDFVMLCRLP
jgi:ribosomal protein S18 acetylase RimI-like enzyme